MCGMFAGGDGFVGAQRFLELEAGVRHDRKTFPLRAFSKRETATCVVLDKYRAQCSWLVGWVGAGTVDVGWGLVPGRGARAACS